MYVYMLSKQDKLYFIDLFSGPGGLTAGLKKSGFTPLLAIDNDKDACATYKDNNSEANVICEDINNINIMEIKRITKGKKISLLCGGSPCQSFSTIGLRKPDDPRGKLFFKFIDYARELNPDFLIFENVKGILSFKNGKVVKDIISLFKKVGYTINYSLIDCSNLGMCQKRERVIFVGTKDRKLLIPSPKKQPARLIDIIGDLENLSSSLLEQQSVKQRNIDLERIKYIPEGSYFRNNRKGGLKNDIFPSSKLYLKNGEGKTQKYHKLSRTSQTPTVLTNWYTVRTVAHYQNRPLTIQEVARIQSFEDGYKFFGDIKSIYKQIGNAVPPALGQYIGEKLIGN